MRRMLAAAAAALALGTGAAAAAEGSDRLLTPGALSALDGEAVVIDIRSSREYATAHVPGAVNAPYPAWRGPAKNPGEPLSDEALTGLLRSLGLEFGDRAVVVHAGVDASDFGAAARVYWTLKSAGLEDIAILNGGVRGWIADGRPLSVEGTVPEPSQASFTLADTWMIGREGIAEILAGERAAVTVDARPKEFHAGEAKHPAAEKPGTLAGSENLRFDTWFEEGATEIPLADRVRALADETLPANGAGETVSFCNTGHWAAINWFALSELAGREDVKLYPESMVGWVNAGGEAVTGE